MNATFKSILDAALTTLALFRGEVRPFPLFDAFSASTQSSSPQLEDAGKDYYARYPIAGA